MDYNKIEIYQKCMCMDLNMHKACLILACNVTLTKRNGGMVVIKTLLSYHVAERR